MQGITGTILFFSGLALPVLFRRRWLNGFFLPGSVGSWLLASAYLVLPMLLYFIGLCLEQGKLPSEQGLRTIAAILLGIWLLTGAPALLFGVLKAIRCRRTRQTLAAKRHLPLVPEMAYPDLFPRKLSWLNPSLKNALEVAPGTFIASVVRAARTRTKGTDLLLLEKTARYPTFMAVRSKTASSRTRTGRMRPRRTEDLLADCRITVNDHEFLIVADLGRSLEEPDLTLPGSRDVAASVLHRLAEQGPELLNQVEGVCLHGGHMLILLTDLLDSEEQLSRWVSAGTELKVRPRIREEERSKA